MRDILIAVCGTSPAILTETVWGLAKEDPPTVPDEVVVITTSKGETDIQKQLLNPLPGWDGRTVWQALRHEVFRLAGLSGNPHRLQLSIRLITLCDADRGVRTPAADIRSREDNAQTANSILQTVDSYAILQDHRVIASIAGGRKTMGALMYGAMSLVGRETDRCMHVLVSEPFESVRGFYFPSQPVQELEAMNPSGRHRPVRARDAGITLADIPFVPLRNRFAELNERLSFAGLVAAYSKAERRTEGPPQMELDEAAGVLTVDGRRVRLGGRNLLITAFLFRRAREAKPHFANKSEAEDAIADFNSVWRGNYPFHQASNRISAGGVTIDDIPKALADIRRKLKEAGLTATVPFLAPERGRIGFDIAAS